jgi:uncharacterized membrane protein
MMILLAFLIGFFAGLRSLTAPAMVSWAVYLGWLKLERPFSLIGAFPAAVVLTLLAFGELVADKLPNTPNRTAPLGLMARVVTGGVSGACVAAGHGQSPIIGVVLGVLGGVVGCFAGYLARRGVVKALGLGDSYIASLEDIITIGGCFWVVTR